MRTRSRKSNETIAELASDIERLVRLAYPTASIELRQEIANDKFIESLADHEMQFKIREGQPHTLSTAIDRAHQIEILRLASNTQQPNAVRRTDGLTRGPQRHYVPREEYERRKKFNLCYFCAGPHLRRNCPSLPPQTLTENSPQFPAQHPEN